MPRSGCICECPAASPIHDPHLAALFKFLTVTFVMLFPEVSLSRHVVE